MIENLITSDHRHLLYKDEVGDTFLLTDFGEIYEYSKDILKCLCFNRKKLLECSINARIFDQIKTDEPLHHFSFKTCDLDKILAVNRTSRRFKKMSRYMKMAEDRLGHKIIPYKPSFLKPETGDIPKQFLKA